MSSTSYFTNASNFAVHNLTFNNYCSESDGLQYLHKHSATSAMHDSEERYPPPLCHPGTCEAVISEIEAWYRFEIPPEKKIMWVHAPAGFGKTAVAGTVSRNLEGRTDLGFNPVGATFFFWRTSPERNSPKHFVITVAYQLTMAIPELAPHIQSAVMRSPMVLNKALEVQLMKLIVEPFKSLGELDDIPHRLIVVDGLDECINSDQESRIEKQYAQDQERVQVRVLDLIRTLQSHQLPLCFLILSRPEPWIERHIKSRPFREVMETIDLYKIGDHLKDAEKYVRHELARIAESLDPQPSDEEQWPTEDLVTRFLWRTRGHMLYASTVIRHIDTAHDDPRRLLQDIVDADFSSTPDLSHSYSFSSLHELYSQILRSCPPANRVTMIEVLEEIMVNVPILDREIVERTPLNVLNIFDRLLGRTPGRGIKAIRSLHGVIRLDNTMFPINPFYHSSFKEFLQHRGSLLPDVMLDRQNGVRRLLKGCLQALMGITLDCQPQEIQVRFALLHWTAIWSEWKPSEGDDPSSLFELMLGIDLKACFIHIMLSVPDYFPREMQSNLYHPTLNPIFHGKSFSVATPLAQDVLSHLRSSVEGVFLQLLHPDYFASHQDLLFGGPSKAFGPSGPFPSPFIRATRTFMEEVCKHRPPAFDNVVWALRRLFVQQEHLFNKLEDSVLNELERSFQKSRNFFIKHDDKLLSAKQKTSREAIKNIFELARQEST